MGQNSTIEWTDHTFNPWEGCQIVSPGCAHCYAAARDRRLHGGAHWKHGGPRLFHSDAYWREPLKWDRAAAVEGVRRRVFCASLADVFEDRADLVAPRARLFALIRETPHIDWLLLTKRPENAARLWGEAHRADPVCHGIGIPWPHNVWLGTTVEDQQRADERIPHLLAVPAVVRFLSCEPLLGPVDLDRWIGPQLLHWVIAGGESGRGARPMHPAWARSLRDQCTAAGVAFFFKQWGEWVPIWAMASDPDCRNVPALKDCPEAKRRRVINLAGGHGFHGDAVHVVQAVGKAAAGRELDGCTHDEFPGVRR